MTDIRSLSDAQLEALYTQMTDPAVSAIHSNESGGASNARADIVNAASGARGSMQTMPKTARDPGFGVKPSDGTPQDDARTGVEYYAAMQKRYSDPTVAAVAYNWGPGNADKWIANGSKLSDLPNETLDYLEKFQRKSGYGTDQPQQQPQAQPAQAQQKPQAETSFMDDLTHQLGLTARAAGHGIADAAGVLANPIAATMNTIGKAFGHDPGFPDTDTLLRGYVDKYTPAPANSTESVVNDIAGAVANPINLALGNPASLAKALPRVLGGGAAVTPVTGVVRNAAMGTAAGANQPVHGNTDLGQYATGVGIGGVAGGVLGAAGRVMGGGKPTAAAQTLMDRGVNLTPGQALGGVANRIEDIAQSVPLAGLAIRKGREGSLKDFNRAIYQNVLDPIGEKAPKTVGRGAIEEVDNIIGQRYDDVLPQVNFLTDTNFKRDMTPIWKQARKLPTDTQNAFSDVMGRIRSGMDIRTGAMSGRAYKDAESVLNNEIKNFSTSTDAFQRKTGELLKQVREAMKGNIERNSPPGVAAELAKVNNAYSLYTALRNGGARLTAGDAAPITAKQFQAAVKAGDKSVGKGAFAKGRAKQQGLSDAGVSTLANVVPDSGTAERILNIGAGQLLGGGATGLAGLFTGLGPIATGAAIATPLYGTNVGKKAMLAALFKRPDIMKQMAAALDTATPGIAGGMATQGQ